MRGGSLLDPLPTPPRLEDVKNPGLDMVNQNILFL